MSKIEQLYQEWRSLQPISDTAQQRLRRKFMLEFNYNSNHLEGNTLTYGQTEILLLFGRVIDSAKMKDLEDMKASNVALNMMQAEAASDYPLTETFIRQLHKTMMREDYEEHRTTPGGQHYHYTVHAGVYKTRPNSVITQSGERFEYASPEETPALMTDLINWYREAEASGEYSLAELCALFHYRYIRIHPFEDGNGRIVRLLLNFILHRHGYPMIVVKTTDRTNYLKALEDCDGFTGTIPSAGANATLKDIKPLVAYIEKCMQRALETCISAAKGEVIAEKDDYAKEMLILDRNMDQKEASHSDNPQKNMVEVNNVLRFVFMPVAEQLENAVNTATIFFERVECKWLMSPTMKADDGTDIPREADSGVAELHGNTVLTESLWFVGKLSVPKKKALQGMTISKQFFIVFFDDHYFVDGILNKSFAYGSYPSEIEKQEIIEQFKEEILNELRERL